MLTSYIPSRVFDGIRCQAMGVHGCKYSIAYLSTDGKVYNSGAKTIADARERIQTHDDIIKLVVYIYHRKKETFEHCKTFVRE